MAEPNDTSVQAEQARTDEGFEPAPEPRALSKEEIRAATDQAAEGIADLESDAADPNELSRQLEELTSVVLSSAEVSTRSASVAADVSGDMKSVMVQIGEDHRRTVLHSRVLMMVMGAFVVLAVGILFAVSVRLLSNVRQLDALTLQVGKRVVELDETIHAFGKASQSLFELTEKLDTFQGQQATITPRFDQLDKTVSFLADKVNEVNLYRPRPLDDKFQGLQKQLGDVSAQVQSLEQKLANTKPPVDESSQKTLAEVQALNKRLSEALTKLQSDVDAIKARPVPAAAPAPAPKPQAPKPAAEPKPAEPKPAAKPAAAKAEPKSDRKAQAKTEPKPEPKPVTEAAAAPAPAPSAPKPVPDEMVVFPRPSR